VIGAALSVVLTSAASQSVDAQARARQFLEAFAANPATAKQFATKDATIVVGDIGGPYGDYVPILKSEGPWLKTCRVDQFKKKPEPPVGELKNDELPPRYRGGTLSLFEGAYMCTRPDGSKFDFKFELVLKDDRVVDIALGERPK
jgi:hypothetical protein